MRLSIVITVLAFLAIPAIASAHGGNNDPNVVHACIGNVSKVVRVVGVSGSCLAAPALVAETPAHWAIQGPPGAPGTNGANGTNGAPGINGTNGTNGTNGINGTSVTFVDYFSGNQGGCPNGGVIYTAGTPPVNAYVCNGTNGTNGTGGTRADGPCFNNTNRYVDCGNGTVTDTVTGLIWLKQADCLANNDWAAANVAAAGLKAGDCGGNLTDNSSPGDWRLPTKDEWSATIARAVALNCTLEQGPSLTNDAGTACLSAGLSSFAGVASDVYVYWSSSSIEDSALEAWVALLFHGQVISNGKVFTDLQVWPVRGGPR